MWNIHRKMTESMSSSNRTSIFYSLYHHHNHIDLWFFLHLRYKLNLGFAFYLRFQMDLPTRKNTFLILFTQKKKNTFFIKKINLQLSVHYPLNLNHFVYHSPRSFSLNLHKLSSNLQFNKANSTGVKQRKNIHVYFAKQTHQSHFFMRKRVKLFWMVIVRLMCTSITHLWISTYVLITFQWNAYLLIQLSRFQVISIHNYK